MVRSRIPWRSQLHGLSARPVFWDFGSYEELFLVTFSSLPWCPGGAAEAAGLEAKDQILAVDGEPVILESDLEAVRLFESVYARDDVILTVLRDGQELDVEIVAAPMPAAELAQRMAEERPAAVEVIHRQEARQWLETRAAQGPFVLVVERRDGDLSVRIDGGAEEVPTALVGVFRDTPFLTNDETDRS